MVFQQEISLQTRVEPPTVCRPRSCTIGHRSNVILWKAVGIKVKWWLRGSQLCDMGRVAWFLWIASFFVLKMGHTNTNLVELLGGPAGCLLHTVLITIIIMVRWCRVKAEGPAGEALEFPEEAKLATNDEWG